jgi:hypothetical protein
MAMEFATLMRRADQARRHENDPATEAWWTGYIRGLRYTHHTKPGRIFGTPEEHLLYLDAAESGDERRAALGRGYRAGLAFYEGTPEDFAEAKLQKE